MLLDLIKLSRPKHWVKNVFVLMPAPFAFASGAVLDVPRFGIGFAAFCLANSAVYAFNDAQDAERDRLHDEKKHRPVASGRVSVTAARAWAVVMILACALLAWQSGSRDALAITAIYLCANIFYTYIGKNIPLVDVFLLATFFLLRVLLGCALLAVLPSQWLLLCSGALALFLGLIKRRSDVIKGLDESHRPSLSGYNAAFLDQAIGMTATMTIVAYALYSLDAKVLMPGREFTALPFVVFGVLDVLRIAYVKRGGSSPVDMLLGQPTLLLAGAGYLGATLWSIRF